MNIPDDIEAAKRRRDQVADLIRTAEAEERRRAQAAAEEARRQQSARDAVKGLTLDDMRDHLAELDRRIAEQETHVRLEAQREQVQRQADRLAAEIEIDETRIAEKRARLAATLTALER